MNRFFVGAIVGVCAIVFVQAVMKNRGPLDATDDHVTGHRSNLEILIDHGTGCQYLRGISGGVTPRLDAAGKPICVQKGTPQ